MKRFQRLLAFCILFLSLLFALPALAAAGDTTRVSVNSSGEQGNYASTDLSISPDGRYVTFRSFANNLVSGDTNEDYDIFLHDHTMGTTTLISVSSSGGQGNGSSSYPSSSSDGRYVAFQSLASNLVSGDTNKEDDIFVHDRITGATTRVSVSSSGGQGNDASILPSISSDGRYVAFESGTSNLVSGDTNGARDIFVHDRQTGITTRVSVDSSGAQSNAYSFAPAISEDGRYVGFTSDASNLVSGDTNGARDSFVNDRTTGETTRVSVSSTGVEGNDDSGSPSISSDGRYVMFNSSASNLVSGDTNEARDIFVHDRTTGETTRVSVSSSGEQGNGAASSFSISPNGRYVAFSSNASNLVSGDMNGQSDIFIHDRSTGVTTRISVSSSGVGGNSDSSEPSISSDGRYVAFRSFASNLVSGDTNGTWDVFVHEVNPPPTLLSFTRQNPPSSPTHAETLVFRATFSEDVQHVDAADFTVSGTTATITTVTSVTGMSVYDLTVSGGDLAAFNGTVGLDLAAGQDITDMLDNPLPAGEPAIDQTYYNDLSLPLAATLVSPAGEIVTSTPAYTWNVVSNATWYYLWVNGPSGNALKQWYEASAVCEEETCSVAPSTALASGAYTWWVQTWNSSGYGLWSARMDFSYIDPALPGKATLLSPNGSVWMKTPTYTWNKDPDAIWYYLYVNGPSGNVIKQWYEASAICSEGTCSVTPSIPLSAGAHKWWIQTWSSGGYGPWSNEMTFTIPAPTLPGKATLIDPSGSLTTTTPTYTWQAASDATWYYLWVNGPSGNAIKQWYEAAAICSEGTCAIAPGTALSAGEHKWWIRTWSSAGYGPWSDEMIFNVP